MKKIIAILLAFLLIISTFSINIAAATKDDLVETGATATTTNITRQPESEYDFGSTITVEGNVRAGSSSVRGQATIYAYLDSIADNNLLATTTLSSYTSKSKYSFNLTKLYYGGSYIPAGNHTIVIYIPGWTYSVYSYDESQNTTSSFTIKPGTIDTKIDISTSPSNSEYGEQENSIKGNLKTTGNVAIPGATLDVLLDGEPIDPITTESSNFTYNFDNPLAAGSHNLTLKFSGGTIGGVEYNAAEDKVCPFTVLEDKTIAFTDVTGPGDGVVGDTYTVKGKLNSAIEDIEVRAYLDSIDEDHFLKSVITEREYDWGWKAKEFSISFIEFDNGGNIPAGQHTVYLVSKRQVVNNVGYKYAQDSGSTFNVSAQATPQFSISKEPSDGYKSSAYILTGNLKTSNGQVIEGATVKAYIDNAETEDNLIGTFKTKSEDFTVTYPKFDLELGEHSIILKFEGDTIGGVQYLPIQDSRKFVVKDDETASFFEIITPEDGVLGDTFTIKGKLSPSNDSPVVGLIAKAYLDEVKDDNYLGQATTEREGSSRTGYKAKAFSISFSKVNEEIIPEGEHTVILVFDAQSVDGIPYKATSDNTSKFTVSTETTPVFSISTKPSDGYQSSEYTLKGNLKSKSGKIIEGATVKAYIDDASTEENLIETYTVSSGDFTVSYKNRQISPGSHKIILKSEQIVIDGVTYFPTESESAFTVTEDVEATITLDKDVADVEKGKTISNSGKLYYRNETLGGLQNQKVLLYLDKIDPENYIGETSTSAIATTFTVSIPTDSDKFTLGAHKLIVYWDGGIVDFYIYGTLGLKPISKPYNFNVTAKITYDANGGTISQSSETIYENKPVSELLTPTWDGHIFRGWSINKEEAEYVTDDITESVQLYAIWEEEQKIEKDPDDKSKTTNTDPLYIVGAQTRDDSQGTAGLRFLVRISDQYIDLTEVEYGCALFTKDAFLGKYGEDKELLADSELNGKTAGKKLIIDRCYSYEGYNIYSVVVASNALLEGESLYETDFIARPYIKYTDGNGKDQYVYYTETESSNVCGKGYYTSYKEALEKGNKEQQNALLQTKEVPASSGIEANDSKVFAQTGSNKQTYMLGDANEDDLLSIADATHIQLSLVGLTGRNLQLFNAFRYKADANQNNKIDISDVTAIQQELAKMTSSNIGDIFDLPIDTLDGGIWSPVVK